MGRRAGLFGGGWPQPASSDASGEITSLRTAPIADEAFPELFDVSSAAGGLQPFADRERFACNAASLVDVTTVEVSVGKHYRHEEVAPDVVA